MRQDNDNRKAISKSLSLLTQTGFTIAACVLTSVLLGRFLDRVFGTKPWLLLILSLLGAATAIKSIFELSKRF